MRIVLDAQEIMQAIANHVGMRYGGKRCHVQLEAEGHWFGPDTFTASVRIEEPEEGDGADDASSAG